MKVVLCLSCSTSSAPWSTQSRVLLSLPTQTVFATFVWLLVWWASHMQALLSAERSMVLPNFLLWWLSQCTMCPWSHRGPLNVIGVAQVLAYTGLRMQTGTASGFVKFFIGGILLAANFASCRYWTHLLHACSWWTAQLPPVAGRGGHRQGVRGVSELSPRAGAWKRTVQVTFSWRLSHWHRNC